MFFQLILAASTLSLPSFAPGSEHEFQEPLPSDFRGPCPGLNTLANHGFLPRTGDKITVDDFVNAVSTGYGLSAGIAKTIVDQAFKPLNESGVHSDDEYLEDGKTPYITLYDLGLHNHMEHDVSLFHRDAYFGDQIPVDSDLIEDLSQYSYNGVLKTEGLVKHYQDQYRKSKQYNPELQYGFKQELASALEVFLVLNVFGRNGEITDEDLVSFVVENRIPEGWERPKDVSLTPVAGIAWKLWNARRKA